MDDRQATAAKEALPHRDHFGAHPNRASHFMKNIRKINKEIRDAEKRVAAVKEWLRVKLLALPPPTPASGIVMRGERCAVVSCSKLVGGRWGADNYLFDVQYRALAGIADKPDPIKKLLACIHTGRVEKVNGSDPSRNNMVYLHPEVIGNLRRMLLADADRA